MAGKKTTVIIIDDSILFRKMLCDELKNHEDIEVVATAPDPYIGKEKIVEFRPDVVVLDIEMPKMDGLTFLGILMKYYPLPIIIVSSLGQKSGEMAVKALELGAAEVMAKPQGTLSVKEMSARLADKIRAVSTLHLLRRPAGSQNVLPVERPKQPGVLAGLKDRTVRKFGAIGASTGGTEAIREILQKLPADMPPLVITQHMPPVFTKSFADRLNGLCSLEVKEAEDGEPLTWGKALVAPGDYHMTVASTQTGYRVVLNSAPPVHHQRPSVDVLFESVAKTAGARAVGVLLTGMGKDGARGLLQMRNAGALTLAQDEKSSVVYGMPKEAASLGAAMRILPLDKIHEALLSALV